MKTTELGLIYEEYDDKYPGFPARDKISKELIDKYLRELFDRVAYLEEEVRRLKYGAESQDHDG